LEQCLHRGGRPKQFRPALRVIDAQP
jgi:hypothetical protein